MDRQVSCLPPAAWHPMLCTIYVVLWSLMRKMLPLHIIYPSLLRCSWKSKSKA